MRRVTFFLLHATFCAKSYYYEMLQPTYHTTLMLMPLRGVKSPDTARVRARRRCYQAPYAHALLRDMLRDARMRDGARCYDNFHSSRDRW